MLESELGQNSPVDAADAMVIMDNKKCFFTYMHPMEVNRILNTPPEMPKRSVRFIETNEKPIPPALKRGEVLIEDVLVRLSGGTMYNN